MSDYETCRSNFNNLVHWYTSKSDERNEATTRFQLIDRLFFECLGWSKEDVILEDSYDGEYADYTFLAPRQILIVEAKRESDYFELPTEKKSRLEYTLPSLMRDYPKLKAAIKQATGYCQTRGVPLGAVCNGHQMVAFVATRNDGLPPLDGKALVFPSLEDMFNQFIVLWEALSKPAIEQKKLYSRLIGDTLPEIPSKLSANITNYPGVVRRNPFQVDLQVISDTVIEDLTRSEDLEVDFLKICYAQSGALSQYSLISKAILEARYSALFDADMPGPAVTPAVNKSGISQELLAESLSRRPILLIGDVGVGKTTFIRHLIKIDAPQIFHNAITINIDLGYQATLSMDLKDFIPKEIMKQLREKYDIDIEENNFIRGVYHLDLRRFGKGIYGEYRNSDPSLFKQKEIEFLDQKVQIKEQYLKDAIEHIFKGRKKQIIMFLDNSAQRSEDTQQQAFLIAQELAAGWPATIFVALRPETYYRSMRVGVLSGYHPKAFTISPPRVDQVIQKRLEFALRITSGEFPIASLNTSIRVKLDKLDTIIRVFLDSLNGTGPSSSLLIIWQEAIFALH